MASTTTKRLATRSAWFLGATACAFVVTSASAGAQELSADLVGSASTCSFNGRPILAEGAPICGAEIRVRTDEVRFGAESTRGLPRDGLAFNPVGVRGCVNANALPPDPTTYNCTVDGPLYTQCVVELNVATGAGGRQVNEAACLLRNTVTFEVRDPGPPNTLKYLERVRLVECLVYANAQGAARNPTDDAVLGEPVNLCTVGARLRAPLSHPLADAQEGWRVRLTQNITNPRITGVTSPFAATFQELLF